MTVPVVDLAPFAGASRADRERIGRAVDDACRDVGFLVVTGHGVPDDVTSTLWRTALAFFDLPLEQRLEVPVTAPGRPYGYNPFSLEALNRSIGGDAPPDLKETFNVGPIDPPPRPLEEMDDPDERDVYAPNHWPPALPELRPSVEEYYHEMAGLASRLMDVFAVALGLPDGWFAPLIDRHGSALRLAHYPALDRPPAPGQLRAGAHTDYGTLTVLAIDAEPGLQVQLADGGWTAVQYVPGGLVVNLGDLMARWTNDRWRSTMHRVVVPDEGGDRRRLSIPFFHNANWDARIECIVTGGEAAKYPPTSAGHHLMAKFRATIT